MIVEGYEVMRGDDADELGRGGSGVVWRGRHVTTDTIVAVKRVGISENTREERETVAKYVMNEVELLRSLRHENIVTLIDYKKLPGYLYIFLEYCENGDLTKFIFKRHALSPRRTISFIRDLSRALGCLHRQDPIIVHRDIKPENMLVFASSAVETKYIIKLTDLAFSRRTTPGQAALSTVLGTPEWWAPELRAGTDGFVRYHKESDIFSAGLVFLALIDHISGEVLHAFTVQGLSLGEWMNRQSLRGIPVTMPSITKASDDALKTIMKGVILQMINPDAPARCSIQQICNTIDVAYAIPVSSIEPGEEATSSRGAEGATPSRGEGGAAAGRQAEGATPNRGAKEATKKTTVLGKLRARFGATSLETKTIPVSSIEPGEEATSSRGAEGATPSRGAEGATPSRGEGGATPSRGEGGATPSRGAEPATPSRPAKGATKKTSPGSSLVAKFGAASLETKSAHIEVRKLSSITLPSTDPASVYFGQDSFIVGFENDPNYHYYKYSNTQYKSMWIKAIPDGLMYDTCKQISDNRDIFIHRYNDEVWRHNEDLKLKEKLSSPGTMIGLLHGGKDAVLDNYAQITEGEAKRVSVAPVTNLLAARYHLDIPRDGAYREEDILHACGRQDGRVVVIALEEPFVDFYTERGRHVSRTPLPHGAGVPGGSETHVLVPLWKKPQICVFNWTGDLLQTLGPDQLGLHTDDMCAVVSNVWNGRFSLFLRSPVSHNARKVPTYKII